MTDYVIRATGGEGQVRAFIGTTTNMVEEARRLQTERDELEQIKFTAIQPEIEYDQSTLNELEAKLLLLQEI